MSTRYSLVTALMAIICQMCGASLYAHADDAMTWKEEVLLHDGRKMTIERAVKLGGYVTLDSRERRALGETVTFVLPESKKTIVWKTDFRDSMSEPNSLNPLVLDIVNGVPYIAAYPAGCIAYNKWKRPNPPYIFFKYDGVKWKRIPLEEFPPELSQVNIIIGRPSDEQAKPYYTIDDVKELNSPIKQPEYQSILREPLNGSGQKGCTEMIRTNDGWEGLGFFRSQPSYEACLKYCERKGVIQADCPCETLFEGAK